MTEANFYFSERLISPILASELKRLGSKRSKILDDGCGDGVMLKDLDDLGYFKKARVFAIDISRENIRVVKRRGIECGALVSDAQKLPFGKNMFDFVYSWMVIEHVEDMGKMVSEIKRVLKPSGRCYVSSVLKLPWAIYFYRKNGKFVIDPTHLYEFRTKTDFTDLFTGRGFRLIKFRKESARYSVLELAVKVLIRLRLIKPSIDLREVFAGNKFLAKIRELVVVPIPGFYHIEGLFEKK